MRVSYLKVMEINYENLEDLSTSDLAGLVTLIKLYPNSFNSSATMLIHLNRELEKRLSNIFIF